MAASSGTVLATERLLLSPLRRDDLDDLLAYALQPELWRYLPLPEQTPESVAARLARQVEANPARREFAVERRAEGRLIGTARIGLTDVEHGTGDLGWAVNSEFWGHGYATEAARALLAFGFGEFGLHRIWATADARNERFWRVMERVGMRREGLMRGERRDSVLCAILATDPRP